MNILIMSPGRRVEIVDYFKKELSAVGGFVYTLDMSSYTPALYAGDRYYRVEKDFDNLDAYMQNVLQICRDNNIKLVLTLIDPELPLLAEYKKEFEKDGTKVMISENELVDATLDKYLFFTYFADTLPVIPTFNNKKDVQEAITSGEMGFPIFAKPRKGSGSEGLLTIQDIKRLESCESEDEYIFQPYMKSKEFGIDMFFNLNTGVLEQYFIKEKLSMRSGETDKSVSVHNEDIKQIIMTLSGKGFRGTVDMDVFLAPDGKYYVNEINPRFGGGYPHAYHCGMNYMKNIVNELLGKVSGYKMDDYEDGVLMMKYNNYYFKDNK